MLTKQDLTSHLYSEILDEITRNDDAVAEKAIASAVAEAQGYLGKYNMQALFASNNVYLQDLIKDIAVWKLLRLANPTISLELYRTNYEDAIKTLGKIQKGDIDPPGWPYPVNDLETRFNESGFIQATSNRKRNQHY